MPEQPPRKLPPLGFAGFEDSSTAAGPGRRKSRWALWPTQEPGAGRAVDAARFVKEGEVLQGLGRKAGKE